MRRLNGEPHSYNPKSCFSCGREFTPTGSCSKRCETCRVPGKRIVPEGICSSCNGKLDAKGWRRCIGCRTKGSRAKMPGIGTGQNNPTGKDSPHYVNGSGLYKKAVKSCCERCGSKKFLCVHHKDENRKNNKPGNLETLCKRCHQIEHGCVETARRAAQDPEVRKKISNFAKNRTDLARGEMGRYRKKT